jgi:hypothetical protein
MKSKTSAGKEIPFNWKEFWTIVVIVVVITEALNFVPQIAALTGIAAFIKDFVIILLVYYSVPIIYSRIK